MRSFSFVFSLYLFTLLTGTLSAQDSRERYALPKNTHAFTKALEKGTRTKEGKPGPNYWTNRANYKIVASLDPKTAIVKGVATITYLNNSPKSLRSVRVHLRQNLHRDDSPRSQKVEITGGVTLGDVTTWDPNTMQPTDGVRRLRRSGTVLSISLRKKIVSGGKVILRIPWSYKVPKVGAPRNGRIGEDLFYLGYWYPQMAVFDDVESWVADPYMGSGEFYMGYGDYDVSLTVPSNFIVRATGSLANAEEVLSARSRDRLEMASQTEDVVHIVTAAEVAKPGIMADADDGKLTWRFVAENVRDFAIGCANNYMWDATHAKTEDGKTSMIHAVYRQKAQRGWRDAAAYARHTIEFMSKHVYPYPYPHVSACEGASGGGMEFPMMTTIAAGNRQRSIHGVVTHELIHMWFPMIAGSNEKRYAWMDEGMTSALTALATNDYWKEDRSDEGEIAQYAAMAGKDWERPTMTHSDHYGVGAMAYGIATYAKTSAAFLQLRAMIGADTFYRTLQDYVKNWAFKHPRPEDLFATFSRVSGLDLGWYFRTWFFETWTLDQTITNVEFKDGKSFVTVADMGTATAPTTVEVTMADGSTLRQTIPVTFWMKGDRSKVLEFDGEVIKATVDPDRCAVDNNRRNDRWAK